VSSLTLGGSLALCVIYYVTWMHILPYFGKYTIRQETIYLDNEGTNTHRLVKVPNHEVDDWDARHDATGKALDNDFENDQVDRDVTEKAAPEKAV
jgi:hypothetical protein